MENSFDQLAILAAEEAASFASYHDDVKRRDYSFGVLPRSLNAGLTALMNETDHDCPEWKKKVIEASATLVDLLCSTDAYVSSARTIFDKINILTALESVQFDNSVTVNAQAMLTSAEGRVANTAKRESERQPFLEKADQYLGVSARERLLRDWERRGPPYGLN